MKKKSILIALMTLLLSTSFVGVKATEESLQPNTNQSIEILSDNIVLVPGYQLQMLYKTCNLKNAKVLWEVEDNNIANVDETGLITGIDIGLTILSVQVQGQPELSDSIEVMVIDNDGVMLKELYDVTLEYVYSDAAFDIHDLFREMMMSNLISSSILLDWISNAYPIPEGLLPITFDNLLYSYNSRLYDNDYTILENYDALDLSVYDVFVN